jgi:ArsR family transcriptional regulator
MLKRMLTPMHLEFSKFFQLLSDETRLRSLFLLHQEGELCVCELMHALGEIQPKISRHLAALRDTGIVLDRRQGQWVYYRINPKLPNWARQVIKTTLNGAATQQPFVNDLTALTQMPNRPGAPCCA